MFINEVVLKFTYLYDTLVCVIIETLIAKLLNFYILYDSRNVFQRSGLQLF